jgi:FKBP-type peptidyl-prolyl cis-trans isomerase FklB
MPRNVTIDNMRKSFFAAVLLAAGTMLVANGNAQQTPAAKTPPAPSAGAKEPAKAPAKSAEAGQFKTKKEKFSYALGMNIGTGVSQNLKKQAVEFDPKLVVDGLKDSLSGGKTLMTPEEAQAVLREVQVEVQKEQQEKMKQAADKNKTGGEAFLAANKDKEGVVTLPSGLQYKILTEGTGPKPTQDDSVVCNYRGTLVDGKEFDSSYKRGQPATFPVKGVIKGWTEALQLMPVGSKWQLFVPPSLAYGEQGAGADIGPNSTLIFEVELISIQEKPKPQEAKPEDKKPDEQKRNDQKPDQQQ